MQAAELWLKYCERNPSFRNPDGDVTLTVRGLKKLFDQTFAKGHELGVSNGRAIAEREADKPRSDSLFGKIFG